MCLSSAHKRSRQRAPRKFLATLRHFTSLRVIIVISRLNEKKRRTRGPRSSCEYSIVQIRSLAETHVACDLPFSLSLSLSIPFRIQSELSESSEFRHRQCSPCNSELAKCKVQIKKGKKKEKNIYLLSVFLSDSTFLPDRPPRSTSLFLPPSSPGDRKSVV